MSRFADSVQKWFIVISLSLFPITPVFADTVTSPFSLELSPQSTLALLKSSAQFKAPSGEIKTDLPNQTLTSPYAVSISGIHLTLDYVFNTPTPGTSLSDWSIQSNNISAEIVVDSINASQTLVEQAGGDTLTLQVNASCSNVHLQLAPGSTQMNATVGFALSGATPTFTLNSFQASWAPSAWQITSLSCQGVNGFGALVQQNAATLLASINPFLPAIQSQIQSQLSTASSSPISWTLNSNDSSGVSVLLTPENLQIVGSGDAAVTGQAAFTFSKLNHSTCPATITTLPSTPSLVDSLVLPITTAESLLQCSALNNSLSATFASKSFSSFQSLLGNWFIDLFVWPNLDHFSSSDSFQFDLYPSTSPTFGTMSSNKSGNILFNLTAPMVLSLYAPTSTGMEHYVDFTSTLSGPATLSVKNGVLSFKQKPSGLSLSYYWDQDYIKQYNPDTRIWTSIFAGYLKSYLSGTGVSYTLPVLEAPGAFSMSFENVTVSGSNMTLSLGLQSLTGN